MAVFLIKKYKRKSLMKRLDKKYKKIKVQQTKCIVLFYLGMACFVRSI
jgi:hypothetical protein